jgi:hypothetical protein
MPRPSDDPVLSGALELDDPPGSPYAGDERLDRDRGKDWSVMDVEDLRDYAKVMTIDDLATLLGRSRHQVQKKLIELGLSPTAAKARTLPDS